VKDKTNLIFNRHLSFDNMIKIIALSLKNLNDAITLIENIFFYTEDKKVARSNLTESLSHKNQNKKYWVVTDKHDKAIAITGLYYYSKGQKNVNIVWLGWFGVHPAYRRRGIGSSLLEFTIKEAKRREFKTIKIYTSTDKRETDAHRLYELYGFKKTNYYKDKNEICYKKDLTESPTKSIMMYE
jgi:GNAT superfamily N-acetyltransferase